MLADTKKNPKVVLVGAGPGDVDVLTLKAVKALKKAKAVLYGVLVNEAILYTKTLISNLRYGKK